MCEIKIYLDEKLVLKKIFNEEVVSIDVILGKKKGEIVLRKNGFMNVFNVDIKLPVDWKIKINEEVYKDFIIKNLEKKD